MLESFQPFEPLTLEPLFNIKGSAGKYSDYELVELLFALMLSHITRFRTFRAYVCSHFFTAGI